MEKPKDLVAGVFDALFKLLRKHPDFPEPHIKALEELSTQGNLTDSESVLGALKEHQDPSDETSGT